MRIKRLVIHGFKSFVDRVTLDFPLTPSAIIGPNGCGKSNIVDAIRWVMGEQNPRHLRGRNMEDIIFNGSDKRKPLGMAEVVLTFSNERGRAPARFSAWSEIEVARRLYRSGESEYFLNKTRCRLRDITDLFTDTGLGKGGYSVIEQGQVAWLINARPEERRVIFEEAAGINRFKHRKDTALRRLESTRENLTRVSDIISEVKRQLNSLNRQARKAERYRALREELKGIELSLASKEFLRLEAALSDLTRRFNTARDSEIEFAARIERLEAERDALGGEYETMEKDYNAVREKAYEIEKTLDARQQAIALAEMRLDELARNEQRLTGETGELKTRLSDAAQEISGTEALLEETEGQIADLSQRINALSSALEEAAKEMEAHVAQEAAVRSEIVTTTALLSDIRHNIQSCLRDEESLREREARLAARKKETRSAMEALEAPEADLLERIERARTEKESTRESFESLMQKVALLEGRRKALERRLEESREERVSKAARLRALEEMERNMEAGQAPERLLEKRGLTGLRGLVADVIDVGPGYERAVEAVLGERLRYALVDGQREGLDAVRYLKTNSGGRGGFVPVRDLRSLPRLTPVQAARSTRGEVAELGRQIRVEGGYDGLIQTLLGDAIVVDDLDTAVEVWRSGWVYSTIVTRDGDTISPQGIVTGGGQAERGILQKRGEIRGLQEALSVTDSVIFELEEKLAALSGEIEGAGAALEEARAACHSAELDFVNLEAELRRFADEREGLETELRRLDGELGEIEAALAKLSLRKRELDSERADLEEALRSRQRALEPLSARIAEAGSRKEELLCSVTELKVALAAATERRDSLSRRIEEKKAAMRGMEADLEARASMLEKGRRERDETAESLGELTAAVEALHREAARAREEEIKGREAISSLSDRIKELEARIKGSRSELSELQELKGELSVEMKETEMRLAGLRERIEERYGIDIGRWKEAAPADDSGVPGLEQKRDELRGKLASMGEVNLSALDEYRDLEERHRFLLDQQADLQRSVDGLMKAVARINRTTRKKFLDAFEEINTKFQETFPRFFSGGHAELRLTDEANVLESGIEIVARPPGKRLQNIALLSGGEKALTAVSLIFSIFLIKPSPFCLLDEVDAPLDDANIDRFNAFVMEISDLSQFILITHNKRTMEMVDTLYGVTMEEPGVSKIVSVRI